jgi:hypothetical protein
MGFGQGFCSQRRIAGCGIRIVSGSSRVRLDRPRQFPGQPASNLSLPR